MKKIDITQKILLCMIVSFSILLLSSCTDDKDETKPIISGLTFITYNSYTKVCTYTLKTLDNSAIKSICIYKGDSLIYKKENKTRPSIQNSSLDTATCKYTPNGYKIYGVVEDFGGNITRDTLQSPVVSSVTSPKGDESWTPNTAYTINWSSNFYYSGSVNIQLYAGSSYYYTIASNVTNSGKYTWTVPSNISAGTNYKIRVYNSNLSIAEYYSNQFTIAPYIVFSYPNFNISVIAGSTLPLSWSDNVSENLKIDLYKGGTFYQNIVSSTSSTYYNWIIPTSLPTGSDYKIRISSVNTSTSYFETPNFTITSKTSSIQSLNSSFFTIPIQNSTTIEWTGGESTDKIKIELLKSGSSVYTITSGATNSGSYVWKVPDTGISLGTDYTYKITDLNTYNSAISANFWLTPNLYLNSSLPTTIKANDNVTISWYIWPLPNNSYIDLLNNNDVSVLKIATLVGKSGANTYVWKVPVLSAGTYKIKVTSDCSILCSSINSLVITYN